MNETEEKKFSKNCLVEKEKSEENCPPSTDEKQTVLDKQKINTDCEQFDALFARSEASSPLSSSHPRCYSSCSPSMIPLNLSMSVVAKSQPMLNDRRQSNISSSSSKSQMSNSSQNKSKQISSLQAFLNASNSQNEQVQPLARSCSYKRPQSIKKYRQQKTDDSNSNKQRSLSSIRQSNKQKNKNLSRPINNDSTRKSISTATSRVSGIDLASNDDQWSSPKANRSSRIGKKKKPKEKREKREKEKPAILILSRFALIEQLLVFDALVSICRS